MLEGLGVGEGDRVAIYLPMIPEAVAAMLEKGMRPDVVLRVNDKKVEIQGKEYDHAVLAEVSMDDAMPVCVEEELLSVDDSKWDAGEEWVVRFGE